MTRQHVSTAAGWRLVGACAALSVSVALAEVARPSRQALVVVGLTGAAILAAAAALRWRYTRYGLLLLACCLAGSVRGVAAVRDTTDILAISHGGAAVLTGSVRDGTGARRSAAQVVVDVDHIVQGDVDRSLHAGVLATLRTGPSVLPGDRVQLDVAGLRAPGTAGAESVLVRGGVDAIAQSPTLTLQSRGGPSPQRWLAAARLRLAATVNAALPEPAASVLDGIVFGIPRPIPTDLTAALRDSGLAHVLAVSGLKVVLVAGLITALCGAFAASPGTRLLATGLGVGTYVMLSGAGPAAVRSAIMAGAAWGLHGTGRSPDALPLLSGVAAAMLLVDPGLSADVGFQLSFLGTLGILLFAARLSRRLPGPRLLRDPFTMALCAQLVTLPVMARTFGVVSLVGPLANAVAVPLLTPLIALALAGAVVSVPVASVGAALLQVSGLLVLLIAAIARVAAALPGAAVHVTAWPTPLVLAELAAVGAAVVAWLALRRVRGRVPASFPPPPGAPSALVFAADPDARRVFRRANRLPRPIVAGVAVLAAAAAGGAVFAASTRPDGQLHVAVLDVGGPVAVAVQTGSGEHALIDTGSDPQRLLQSLGAVLPPLTRDLELLVLTGGDRAAVGGMPGLVARYHIGRVVAPDDGLAAAARQGLDDLGRKGAQIDLVQPDAAWLWAGTSWHLLTPDGTGTTGTALAIGDPTGTVLVLGALPVTAQEELAALHPGDLRADLLVTPTSGAVAPALVDAVRPHVVAVPGGGRGTGPAAVPLLSGSEVRRTTSSGTLTYTGSDGGLVAT